MIQRMLISEIVRQLEEKKKIQKEATQLKQKNPKEYEAKSAEFKERMGKTFFLAEDCNLLNGGGFNKGREIGLDEARRILDFGFHLLWVTDEPISEEDKKHDLIYHYKTEFEKALARTMVILDEANAKKPGSTVKMLEGNDLLRQTIEALQLDGAKYLARSIFGESSKRFDNLAALVRGFYKKAPDKIDVFDNTSLGNYYKIRQRLKESKADGTKDKKEEERSNFYHRIMLNLVLLFITITNKIQKLRMERDPNDRPDINRKLDALKRHGYDEDHLIEGALSALFCEYGYLHKTIDELITRLTTPFYNDEGELEGKGMVELNDKNLLVIDKHCNVSVSIFSSLKTQGFVKEDGVGRGILQYHHRGMNDTGYPKRKLVDEKIQLKDEYGNVSVGSKNTYDTLIDEPTRLVCIINFFLEYLFHSPFHIPFQRDNLVRHLLLNSVYPTKPDGQQDKEGIYDIQTQYPQSKAYDGYLVDCFLKSINIYKIGEKVPIYHFNNTKTKLYDAVVVRYNDMPHRPVVQNLETKEEVDLNTIGNQAIYIGEYIPSLRFQDVIDEFHLDKVEGGIILAEKIDDEEDQVGAKKIDSKTAAMLDNIFDDGPQVELPVAPSSGGGDFDLDSLLGSLPPELAKAQAQKEEAKQPEPVFQKIEKVEPSVEEEPLFEEHGKEHLDIDSLFGETPEHAKDLGKSDFEHESEVPIVSESDKDLENFNLFDEEESKKEETFFEPPSEHFEKHDHLAEDNIDDLFADVAEEKPFEPVVKEMEFLDMELSPKESLKVEVPQNLSKASVDDLFEDMSGQDFSFAEDSIAMVDDSSTHSYGNKAESKLYSIYYQRGEELIPYGIGRLMLSTRKEKRFKMKYLAQFMEEQAEHYSFKYARVDSQDQHNITVYDPSEYSKLPFGSLKFIIRSEVNEGDIRDERMVKPLTEGGYYLLYYVKELDSKKRAGASEGGKKSKGEPKYIVQIKKKEKGASKPLVTFIRYILVENGEVRFAKDQNCGKDFDLNQWPYFRVDRALTAKEIVGFLNLKLV